MSSGMMNPLTRPLKWQITARRRWSGDGGVSVRAARHGGVGLIDMVVSPGK
jgi:hypothetical protein